MIFTISDGTFRFTLRKKKMKLLKRILPFVLICVISSAHAQQPSPVKTDTTAHFPALSLKQMLDDHDSLVSLIKQISPVIYFNAEVRYIDFFKHATLLRSQITTTTSTAAFLKILQRTINAAQDGHTSRLASWQLDLMKKYWIPSGAVTGIDSSSAQNAYGYDTYLDKELYTKLRLELTYRNGAYYTLLPFSYKGVSYPAFMTLTHCNGTNVHTFVAGLTELVSPLRWDQENNRSYHETFYNRSELFKNDVLQLSFIDKAKQAHTIYFTKNDTVTFLEKKKRSLSYNSTKEKVITHYFEKEGIFYAKLPFMEKEMGDTIRERIASVILKNAIKAIVIDIRGNGGGSDLTYESFLSKLLKDTLRMNVLVGRNNSAYMRNQYLKASGITLNKDPDFLFKKAGPVLKGSPMFYIKNTYDFVTPDSITYPFSGKIYILQNRYIYSSASNLSKLAKNNSQLISIGENPDLLGGIQTDPTILILPHSKFLFRVEPQIDFTDCKVKQDIFQNHVEHYVPYSVEDLQFYLTTTETTTDKNFLMLHDPMFKKVLDMEAGVYKK